MSYLKDLGIVLVLIGGIVGLIFASVSLAMVPFMASWMGYGYAIVWQYGGMMVRYAMFGYPDFGHEMMSSVMFVWSVLGLAGALLSIYCGLKLRQGYLWRIAVIGIMGGTLLLFTFSWLPGLSVLAGSVIACIE
jgi:hypothetical protein